MSTRNMKTYVGINNEQNGGMTQSGKIIRDAWVFGLIPETETGEGWRLDRLEVLWGQVNAEWEKYDFQVGRLPDELRERFMRIHGDAMKQARAAGWDPDSEIAADE